MDEKVAAFEAWWEQNRDDYDRAGSYYIWRAAWAAATERAAGVADKAAVECGRRIGGDDSSHAHAAHAAARIAAAIRGEG